MPAKPLALAFLQDILLSSATGRELLSCIERVPNVATDVNHQRQKKQRQHARKATPRIPPAYYKEGLVRFTGNAPTLAEGTVIVVECDGRAQGASLLSTHRLAYCPYGLACFSARPVRKTSCWTSALRRASQHDRSKEAGCGKHNARAGLNSFVFNRSARGK